MMARRLLEQVLALVAAGLAAAAPAPAEDAPRVDVIRNVHVVDVDRGLVTRDQTILIPEGKIRHVGAARSEPIPPRAKILDGAGGFLIPGLIDTHVHHRPSGSL